LQKVANDPGKNVFCGLVDVPEPTRIKTKGKSTRGEKNQQKTFGGKRCEGKVSTTDLRGRESRAEDGKIYVKMVPPRAGVLESPG